MPWRTVADSFPGVPAATLCAIYKHNREPRKADIRRALGLPITVPAPVCAKCGQVHVTKRCTQANGKTAKPRIRYKDLWLMMWAAYLSET